jgi:hypothetical protein
MLRAPFRSASRPRVFRLGLASAPLLAVAVATSAFANGWTPLTNQPPAYAGTMMLLTDGRVLMNDGGSVHWWLLTPDANGSYVNGTWSQAADANYDRLYFANTVLADGRVIVSGGEYSSIGGTETTATEIYDPAANTWTVVSAPPGWSIVGDAPATVLADGRWFLGSIGDSHTAFFDPKTDSWTAGPDKLHGSSSEESWVLMPDGSVVTANCAGHPQSERYVPSQGAWIDCGSTPVDLVEAASIEVGAGVLMNDGSAFFMGATPHCATYVTPSTPTAPGTWTQQGDPPLVAGQTIGAKDAPACLLTNGRILCALGPVDGIGGDFLSPTYFFTFDGTTFHRAADPPNNGGPPFIGRMLMLPTGEVAFAAGTIYLFTSNGGPQSSWAPTVSSVSKGLLRGREFTLTGTQLNGLSQAGGYGDDAQAATNYPLIRLTNAASGRVTYCRTHDHSSMGVATGTASVSTRFEVPASIPTGAATLEVVANGIPSTPVNVFVRDPLDIDFDNLPSGVEVTTQYRQATFSSDAGYTNYAYAQSSGNSPPNTLGSGPAGGSVTGFAATYVDFPFPVSALSLRAIEVDNYGPAATLNVFENGTLSASLPVSGTATPSVPVTIDLTAFDDVTRIEIVGITDQSGLTWDDFEFGVDVDAAWSNYGSGYAGTLGVPSIASASAPVLGSSVSIAIGNSLGAPTPGIVLIGAQSASILTSKGGTLLVAPLLWIPATIPTAGLSLPGSIPSDVQYCGLSGFVQALELDPGAAHGFSFTAGLQLTFGY